MDKYQFHKRVLFIGVPDMAYIGLDTLFYSGVNIIGVLGPEKTHNTYIPFKNFVNTRKLNFIEYDNLSDNSFIENIKSLAPDIAVVCSFNKKFPKIFIDSIPDGIINIHPSLLPLYRGGNPYSWVIMNNEKRTGVTLHYITEGFDEGDIIAQEFCEIDKYETMGTIFNKTNFIGCRMLLKALLEYDKTGVLKGTPQKKGDYIQAPNLKEKETFLNFNKPAEELERKIRALNPYISALTIFNNQIIKVHKATVEHIQNVENFNNGEICKIDKQKMYIKTSDGCLIPEVIQYAGLFIGNTEDFINIVKPKVGDKFIYG